MLINGSRLKNIPAMSLQTGGMAGQAVDPVIDPTNLKILGYSVTGPLVEAQPAYLLIADIRELSDVGFIIDSADEFVLPGDVIALDKVTDYNFELIGMSVRGQQKQRIGKVVDYMIDVDSFIVEQLIVRRPFLHSINDTELVIHRTQITEINDKAIIINDDASIPEHTRLSTPGSYVNPFRSTHPTAPSSIDRDRD